MEDQPEPVSWWVKIAGSFIGLNSYIFVNAVMFTPIPLSDIPLHAAFIVPWGVVSGPAWGSLLSTVKLKCPHVWEQYLFGCAWGSGSAHATIEGARELLAKMVASS